MRESGVTKPQGRKVASRIFLLAFLFAGILARCAYAKEIAIIYTGETHSMLYPCNCPIEPDGGVARRASLIQEIRKAYPDALLLDTGNFSAGGLMDDYSQSIQLDTERTLVNFDALGLMKYDAVALGEDELNFGKEFFDKNIKKTGLNVISCNIKIDNVFPYMIKDVSGTKIGIVGVTSAMIKDKVSGLKATDSKEALKNSVLELRKKGADIVVVLSNLDEDENLVLINDIKGIDIFIEGRGTSKRNEPEQKHGAIVLKASWQGRRLGKLILAVDKAKITGHKYEDMRLSDKIQDDPQIQKILPKCFSDANCKKEGFLGACSGAGSLKSSCEFTKASRVNLTIITPKVCSVCNALDVVKSLKKKFPGLETTYLYYPEKKAVSLAKELKIDGLPAYIFGADIEKEKGFEEMRSRSDKKGKYYVLRPEYYGVAYYINRKEIKGQLDLFISLYDKGMKELLAAVKDLKPNLHFLAAEKDGVFDAKNGSAEAEEYLRAVCVQKYYPDMFWGYLNCRAKDVKSSYWEDCLGKVDAARIKGCARGSEGVLLLKSNTSLNKELKVMFGPVFLTDNKEIFGVEGKPNKDDLKKVFKK